MPLIVRMRTSDRKTDKSDCRCLSLKKNEDTECIIMMFPETERHGVVVNKKTMSNPVGDEQALNNSNCSTENADSKC